MGFFHAPGTEHPNAGLYEVEGAIVMNRPKAVLFRVGDGESQWLPRSKIRIDALPGGRVAVAMPKWLAKEKGYA